MKFNWISWSGSLSFRVDNEEVVVAVVTTLHVDHFNFMTRREMPHPPVTSNFSTWQTVPEEKFEREMSHLTHHVIIRGVRLHPSLTANGENLCKPDSHSHFLSLNPTQYFRRKATWFNNKKVWKMQKWFHPLFSSVECGWVGEEKANYN